MAEFIKPKLTKNYNDELRHIGFEIEFSNIDIEKTLNIFKKDFAFKVDKVNNYYYKLNSRYGEFVLELDFELLTKQKLKKSAKEFFKTTGIEIDQEGIESVEEIIGDLSKDIVPYEIGTPPIQIDEVEIVEQIIEKLKQNNAKGTSHKFYYAFGLHLNIEVVSLEVESLLSYMRSYVILQKFIDKDAKVDFTRKITPFIDKFEDDYIKYILDKDYAPSIEKFIDDYLHFNPTRNRSLDMLPILSFIDEKRVRKVLPDEKIKPRPAFHYRLSNSNIGEEGWSVWDEWNRWLIVEDLANDQDSLEELCSEYLKYLNEFIHIKSWEERTVKWLKSR